MLTEAQLRSDISRVWDYASALGLGHTFANPVGLSASHAFRKSSRSNETSYEELYLLGLKNVDYNIILLDYSYFQFSRSADAEFRFAFYPNPMLGASDERVSEILELQEYVAEGIVDNEDYLRQVSEIRVARHPPMLRYEFSEIQYDASRHPASHFHIGLYSDWRWGAEISLTGRYFALTVMRHLYPDAWFACPGVRSGKRIVGLDDELGTLRASCRNLGDDLFAGDERPRLHFV